MPTMKLNPAATRPAFVDSASDSRPYKPGEIPAAWHTFHDFAMPRTYALVSPVNEYGMQFARVYTPNPWVSGEIRFYDWDIGDDRIWRRSQGGTFRTIEDARKDWKMTAAKGWIPRDVIANPLNDADMHDPWDIWACHFSGHSNQFYRLLPIYKFTYPRKAV